MEIVIYLVAALLWALICLKKNRQLGMQRNFFVYMLLHGAFWWFSMILYLASRQEIDYEDWDV